MTVHATQSPSWSTLREIYRNTMSNVNYHIHTEQYYSKRGFSTKSKTMDPNLPLDTVLVLLHRNRILSQTFSLEIGQQFGIKKRETENEQLFSLHKTAVSFFVNKFP